MRPVRYLVAASLDGYIAGPNGEIDWITSDPEIDFTAIFEQFDTALMGRRTYELVQQSGQRLPSSIKTYVFSHSLERHSKEDVTVVADGAADVVSVLRNEPGKDIWLFGGGSLFRTLAEANVVDTVEISIMPVLLGGGVPLLLPPANRIQLKLRSQKIYKSGIVSLEYVVR